MRAEQDRALRAYIRRQVYPYSTANRNRLSAAGIGPYGVKTIEDLEQVTPVRWAEVGDGADLLLRPHRTSITRLGSPALAFQVLLATLLRRRTTLNRSVIEPVYRPIQWLIQEGVPVGCTAIDLERLSEIGRRWLEAAGVSAADVIVSVIPNGPHLDFWQLVVAARRAGVAAAFLDSDPELEDVRRLRPTVLAGRPRDLLALVDGARAAGSEALADVRTVLATGDLLDDTTRRAIEHGLGRDVAVLAAWAPPGVRALWAECRKGDGLHTWPAAELIDVVDPQTHVAVPSGTHGEVVWTALGWAGTVVLRLQTGVRAVMDDSTCSACGRTTPRLKVRSAAKAVAAPFVSILDSHPGVAAWQSELSRRNGSEELVVFLAPSRPGHPGRLVRDLDERLEPSSPATQFVVLNAEALERRLADHDYNRVVDHR